MHEKLFLTKKEKMTASEKCQKNCAFSGMYILCILHMYNYDKTTRI